ncbi:MAG TPA: hypothetical protein VIW26_09925 [Gemmatimonadales bacterium]|jgi:ribosomal protein L16 Arg81 hydroxylase
MGTCEYCGTRFPKTRSTRKYCTTRCKTNACLDRKPRRLRADAVAALYELLHDEVENPSAFRERLRQIIAPHLPALEPARVPTLD